MSASPRGVCRTTLLPQRQNCRTVKKPLWLDNIGGTGMITRIREVRRARGMTLDDVARACQPPTTPQTIGRLETGTRTVSVGWLNRIADALGSKPPSWSNGDRAISVSAPSSKRAAPRRPSGPRWSSHRGPTPARSQSPSRRASAITAPGTRSGATCSSPNSSPGRSTATC